MNKPKHNAATSAHVVSALYIASELQIAITKIVDMLQEKERIRSITYHANHLGRLLKRPRTASDCSTDSTLSEIGDKHALDINKVLDVGMNRELKNLQTWYSHLMSVTEQIRTSQPDPDNGDKRQV